MGCGAGCGDVPYGREDQLFATLDPTTRRLPLPNGKHVLLTDTVGFIQRLPTELVAAFRQGAGGRRPGAGPTHRASPQNTLSTCAL